MKAFTTFLGMVSAAIAALVVRPVNSYQGFMVKSITTAQAPALVIVGAVATVLGLRLRAPVAAITGSIGAATGATYIRRATAPHDGFARAFGLDWERRLPAGATRSMLPRRLTWRLPHVPDPTWTRDVPFWTIPGTGRTLLADLWEPPAGVERSGIAIVYLYGGSWHLFDKDVLTRPFFRYLAAQGHVVMDAAHRSCPETDAAGMTGDVHRAVAWIKEHADRYGIDPARVVVMGGSSGAHIALLAAYAPDDPVLKPAELRGVDTSVMAVVSYYGIPDLPGAFERWLGQEGPTPPLPPPAVRPEPGRVAQFLNRHMLGRTLTAAQSPPAPSVRELIRNVLGGAPEEVPGMVDRASPIRRVSPDCPPTLMFQGTHDAVVPLAAARRLHLALEDAGVPVVYVELPWTEHAFDLMYPPMANPAARAALYDLERFLVVVMTAQQVSAHAPVRGTPVEAVTAPAA